MTTVVHCMIKPFQVYIGRGRNPNTGRQHGTLLSGNPGDYGNPWSHKPTPLAQNKVDTVDEAMAGIRQYLHNNPGVQEIIRHELKDKILGCWCKTKKDPNAPCHGDIYAEICDQGLI